MSNKVTVIIVTHDSMYHIDKCITHLRLQTIPPNEIIIVDSGSADIGYLEPYALDNFFKVIFEVNVGYALANNIGYLKASPQAEYIIFLNPDTFVKKDLIENGIAKLKILSQIGVLSGRLTGFDLEKMAATGLIDSTGIFRKFYGRWYDRGRNRKDTQIYLHDEEVPALCGALLFCRREALESLDGNIFDPDFFLYKEDIEFSLRIRQKRWKLWYSPDLQAYHCRGWQKREKIPYTLKKIAAKSEILLYKKHPSPYVLWAYLKYWLVVIFRL